MIIYNVTVNIDEAVHDEWLTWMKDVHIPDVLKTGLFLNNKICRVLVEEESGITYSVQYTSKNRADYETYKNLHAARLQKVHADRFGGKFVAFRTLLEIVHDTNA
jgi:hypothetical protein